jgi:hypothetical protein
MKKLSAGIVLLCHTAVNRILPQRKVPTEPVEITPEALLPTSALGVGGVGQPLQPVVVERARLYALLHGGEVMEWSSTISILIIGFFQGC